MSSETNEVLTNDTRLEIRSVIVWQVLPVLCDTREKREKALERYARSRQRVAASSIESRARIQKQQEQSVSQRLFLRGVGER